MSAKVSGYGRVGGKHIYTYGPNKKFDMDWGGAFTALEIANVLSNVPKPSVYQPGGPVPGTYTEVADAARRVAKVKFLEDIESLCLDITYIAIHATNVRSYWVNKIYPAQVIHIGTVGKRPSELVAEALKKLELEKWGVVNQIRVALAGFANQGTNKDGDRAMSIFFEF